MKQPDVQKYLWDALNAAIEARSFIGTASLDEYLASRTSMLLVERSLEIVGEALKRAADADAALATEISYLRQIVGLRNVLAHGYAAIRHDRIYVIVHDDLPILIREIEALLPR